MIRELSPQPNSIPKDFYQAKKLVSKLGLKEEKIDCCVKGAYFIIKMMLPKLIANSVKSLGLSPRERKVGGIRIFLKKECIFCH